MDISVPPAGTTSQYPSLDCLRTVEFRQTLRGYHVEDVDDYLEKVAVEAEALQEQLRLAHDRLRQAAERVQALEAERRDGPLVVEPVAVEAAPAPVAADDGGSAEALSRTLLLAQKFVEQTHAEAKAEAEALVADAEASARGIVAEAEQRARSLVEESERTLRDEVNRLELSRHDLQGEVDGLRSRLEGERSRLRGILADLMAAVDNGLASSAGAENGPVLEPLATLAPAEDPPGFGQPAASNGFGH